MKRQQMTLSNTCIWAALLLGAAGCVPAPDRHETEVLPASDLKIMMNKNGRAEVSKKAAEETPVKGDATAEPARESEK